MAMSCVIHKASHTVVPLALRAIASPRILVSSFIKSPTAELGGGHVRKESFGVSPHSHFSTVTTDALKQVDRKLITAVMKSQLKSSKPSDPSDNIQVRQSLSLSGSDACQLQVPEAPPGFPFEIEDNLDELGIKLKREFAGEKIVVDVYDPIYPENWSDKSLATEEHEEIRCFSFHKPRIQLTLNITKECGTTLRIYLWANIGYVGHPEIFIDPGRISNEMSYDKEDYWREFIRIRGIDDSIGKFMMDYMNRRKDRKYLLFWKKVRDFVEE